MPSRGAVTHTDSLTSRAAPRRLGILMAVYLLGIFMGALDTGIVTPARTIIQSDLGVDDASGIWMLTIYTLAYAASIPVMGKLADRRGRKPIYLLSIALFGLGSLLCGLSQNLGSFEFLVVARAIQAIGGGGIVPIATAEFGTSVPPQRRGMALGLVGAVYGVANIFGSSAGSLILDLVGTHNWQYIFFINVPISLGILLAGLAFLPNHTVERVAQIDLVGITLLVTMILALLYGLGNIDFFDIATSLRSGEVYPFLLCFALLLPLFVRAEHRAEDPVLNLAYFTDRTVSTTLALAFLSGVILMGVIFVPQFAENALRIPTGDGGYFVIILGLFSGIGAPLSGTLTDRLGPKPVLGFGLLVSAAAAAVGAWWAIPSPTWASVCTTLALMGLGLGFTIGSPLTYLMLDRTPPHESSSALATLSLVRSLGTTLAPAFLVGFLTHAGTGLQVALIEQLPQSVTAPALPYAGELNQQLKALQSNDRLADRLRDVEFADLGKTARIDFTTDEGQALPEDLVELLRSADVTTITDRTKVVAERLFADRTPSVVADITTGVDAGLANLGDAATDLDQAHATLVKAIGGLDKGIAQMGKASAGLRKGIARLTRAIYGLNSSLTGSTRAIAGIQKANSGLTSGITGIDQALPGQQRAVSQLQQDYASILGQLPPGSPEPPAAQALKTRITGLVATIEGLKLRRAAMVTQRAGLPGKLRQLERQRASLSNQRTAALGERTSLRGQLKTLDSKRTASIATRKRVVKARNDVADARVDLAAAQRKLTALRDGIPSAFEIARSDYLAEVERLAPDLERTFEERLNEGFRGIYFATLGASLLALGLLAGSAAHRRRPDILGALTDKPGTTAAEEA